ncbi:MAG TPA: sugar transferase [Candidatus Limnocylindrales bacterium]|nr:sugar transferase [Candidatus Limnocylindrales bacterium]
MIRRHLMALRVGLMLADGLAAIAVFWLVALLRFGDGTSWRATGIDQTLGAVTFAIIWVAVLWASGLYRLSVRWRAWTELRDLFRATLLVLAIVLSALFLLKQTDVSRIFLGLLFVVQPMVALAGRLLLRAAFEANRRRGHDARYMLVAGTGPLAQDFADRVERHAGLGMRIIGHLAAPGETEHSVTRPILGSVDDIEEILHSRVVDEVAVCLPPTAASYLEPIAGLAAGEGKTVRIAVDPIEELLPGAVQEEFDGFVVRSLVNDGQREAGLILKRAIDIVGAGILLVLVSPLLLGVAAAIRLTDGAPVLFRQRRIGLHGRPFTMLKFRSMVTDAEQRLHEVAHLNERNGAAFKAADDPRMTPIGRWLRKTSIDELPQLWNVLTGTMSLVGPRPPLPQEVDAYDVWHRRRLSMKPGITGLWQVEARHEPDFDRWVEHDLIYIDGWSIWLDLKILAKTLPALIAHGGR